MHLTPTEYQTLTTNSGHQIAYHHSKPTTLAATKRILFLSGFQSSMDGKKASQLAQWAEFKDWDYCRFDYRGHGSSTGNFADFTLQDWLEDALQILQHCFDEPALIIGSSMGSWLAYHIALQKPELVSGIISIATAPDFIDKYLHANLSEEQLQTLQQQGEILLPHYAYNSTHQQSPLSLSFFDAAKRLNLLDRKSIDIRCPIHLLHSMQDDIAPWQNSLAMAEKVRTTNVRVELIKDGDHSLSRLQDLQRLLFAIQTI
jgi:pimeloyl-ACP methyl ester carboxylesterase